MCVNATLHRFVPKSRTVNLVQRLPGHAMLPDTLASGIVQGSTQGHWRFPSNGVEQGYVYLMTHPGTPSLFYDHLEDPQLATTIQRLISLRLRAGIHCRSKVSASLRPLSRTIALRIA